MFCPECGTLEIRRLWDDGTKKYYRCIICGHGWAVERNWGRQVGKDLAQSLIDGFKAAIKGESV